MGRLSLADRVLSWLSRKSYKRGYVNGWNAAEKSAFNDGWEQAKETYCSDNQEEK